MRYGKELARDEQGLVLMAWDNRRYTLTKIPAWAQAGIDRGYDYPPQFRDDLEWLEHTQFVVTMNGRLDKRSRDCKEEPTWPTRPELRIASLAAQAQLGPNLRYPGWAQDAAAEERRLKAEQDTAKTPEQIIKEAMTERDRMISLGLDPTMGEDDEPQTTV